MARTRFIKPGFFMNEELAELPCEARLLFIGLWTIADRDGRLEDRPRKIKAAVFPYEDLDVDSLLGLLAGKKFVRRYRIKGLACIEIDNFVKHQKPHPKEPPSLVPAPEDREDESGEERGEGEERGVGGKCGVRSAELGGSAEWERSAERGARNVEWGRAAECGARDAECGARDAECGTRDAERRDDGCCPEESGPYHEKLGPDHEIQGLSPEKLEPNHEIQECPAEEQELSHEIRGLAMGKPEVSQEVQGPGSERTVPEMELERTYREIGRTGRELERSSRVLPALTKDRRIEGRERKHSEGKTREREGEAHGREEKTRGREGEARGREEKAHRREGRVETSTAISRAGVQRKPEVETVFDYWKHRTGHPDAKLTREREMKIRGRLEEGYTVEELQQAVEGCRGSPFHQGDNERGHRYDDITLICRSGSKVEQFVEMARENRDETRQCGNRSNVRKIMQGIELVRSRAAQSRDPGDDNKQSEGCMLTASSGT
jgi:hypothetical protein